MLEKGFSFKDDIATDECEHGVALIKEHNLDEIIIRDIITKIFEEVKKEHGSYELWSTILVEK